MNKKYEFKEDEEITKLTFLKVVNLNSLKSWGANFNKPEFFEDIDNDKIKYLDMKIIIEKLEGDISDKKFKFNIGNTRNKYRGVVENFRKFYNDIMGVNNE